MDHGMGPDVYVIVDTKELYVTAGLLNSSIVRMEFGMGVGVCVTLSTQEPYVIPWIVNLGIMTGQGVYAILGMKEPCAIPEHR